MKKVLAGLTILMCLVGTSVYATDFDFAGVMQNHNDILLFDFTTTEASTVTLFSSSWIDGNLGFDPMLGLWDSTGQLIYFQDDGGRVGTTLSNGVSYQHGYWDSYYEANVGVGTYTVSLTAYDNFNNGTNLSDGFLYDNETPIYIPDWNEPANGYQTGNYEFHVLNAATASQQEPVPEPATMVLFGLGILGLAGVSRKRLKK